MMQFFKRVRARFHLSRPVLFVLLAVVFCVWGFSAVAEDTGEHGGLVRFDSALENQFHAVVTTQIAPVYEFISLFGSEIVVVVTTVLVIYGVFKRHWRFIAHWLMVIAGGYALNFLLKLAYNRPRPPYANVFVQQFDSSFPSGHAMSSVIFYGMLLYDLLPRIQNLRTRIVLVFIALLGVALIGISRLYLGVHYPSDVIAGYLAGGAWLAICIGVGRLVRARNTRPEVREMA